MVTPENGVSTLGTFFKDKKQDTRFIGKCHFVSALDPDNVIKYKPRLSTENYLSAYDFSKYNKFGDFCYDSRLGFLNDTFVVEQKLQSGNYKDKCDYFYDNVCYDGLIPYLKNNISKNSPFFVIANLDNPHDISSTNISEEYDNSLLTNTSMQMNGISNTSEESITKGTIGLYNEHYNMFQNLELFNKKSFELDNCYDSTTNTDTLKIGVLLQLYSKYQFYGLDPLLADKNKEYQTAYYRCLKQVDSHIEKIYDYLEKNGVFSKAVVCLTSDHGDYVCSHGLIQKASPIYRQSSEIPLFISYPNMSKSYKNHADDNIISQVNLAPTLLVLSKLYKQSEMAGLGLAKPFMNNDGDIINSDYHNARLCLTVAFGPMMLYILQHLSIEINKIILDKIGKESYLSVPTFSVASTLKIDNSLYNGGYYFSLSQVFSQSVNDIDDKIMYIKNLNFKNANGTFILTDSSNTSIIAFVGTQQDLYLMAFSDIVVKTMYIQNIVIKSFDSDTSPYKYFVTTDPIYKTKIYSRLDTTTEKNVNTVIIRSPEKEKEKEKDTNTNTEDVYSIIDKDNEESYYTYSGSLYDLKISMKYNPYVKLFFKNPVIVKQRSKKYYQYVLNDSVIYSVQIWTSNKNKINKLISLYSDLNIWINAIFKIKTTSLVKFINYTSLDNNYNFIFSLVLTVIQDLNVKNLLFLPGVKKSVLDLLNNKYQVQIFNKTTDSDELYNLADSSRVHNNICICNQFIKKLNTNIKYNNLLNIYLSIPQGV